MSAPTSAAVRRACPSARRASVTGFKQVPADELDRGVELEVLVRLLGEAVPLVVGEQIPDRPLVLPDRRYHLLELGVGHTRIVLALDYEQGLGDLRRVVERAGRHDELER